MLRRGIRINRKDPVTRNSRCVLARRTLVPLAFVAEIVGSRSHSRPKQARINVSDIAPVVRARIGELRLGPEAPSRNLLRRTITSAQESSDSEPNPPSLRPRRRAVGGGAGRIVMIRPVVTTTSKELACPRSPRDDFIPDRFVRHRTRCGLGRSCGPTLTPSPGRGAISPRGFSSRF